ncbi:MAG TPA: hypothetical protein PKC39_08990 [Ferruginibacter sp.]|nr:hypothetical protein [Ferruginibacter sp.]HMP21081.1 hypothetical protein [Ferruginibacter sp.]
MSFPLTTTAQQIIFSDPEREDIREMNFEIIGKVGNNVLIFHDVRWKYTFNVYNDSMRLLHKVETDFVPKKTTNIDFVAYPNFVYMVYQYQKKGILYCEAVKIGSDGRKMQEPVVLDTTRLGLMGDNKIYSVIYSEDKKKIMIFKIQRVDDYYSFVTMLFDNDLNLLQRHRLSIDYGSRQDIYSDFVLDNDGALIFGGTTDRDRRNDPSSFYLVVKKADADTFSKKRIDLKEAYMDEVKLKVDNINKRYLINTFYHKERRGNIDGIFCAVWDAGGDSMYARVFVQLGDSVRTMVKTSGSSKTAFNNFFIRNIVLKRDGSYLITAEDFYTQTSGGGGWNRYDMLYTPGFNTYDYYYFNNYYYGGMYRPFGRFGNRSTQYYYDNVLLISLSKTAMPEWINIVHKQQYADDNDNYLSFGLFNTAGTLHLLYNDIAKRVKLLAENIITPDGKARRNPTIKTPNRDYEFMPRFSKQVGARQVIIPCTYRSFMCFARVDF